MDDPLLNQPPPPVPMNAGDEKSDTAAAAPIPMVIGTLPPPHHPAVTDEAMAEAAFDPSLLPAETRGQRMGRRLLMLLAILCAVITCISLGQRALRVATISVMSGDTPIELPSTGAIFPFPWQRSQRRHFDFLLKGDTTRADTPAQQRAIWEAHPESRVYFANYMTYLLQAPIATPEALAHFEQEITSGEQLDPQNALYHYLLADALITQALEHTDQGPDVDKKTGKWSFPYRIHNRRMFDRAMHEYQVGLSKPYLHGYHLDMVNEQIGALSPCRQAEDHLLKIAIGAQTLLPELARLRTLARVAPFYAKTLIAEGRMPEATPYLDSWLPFTRQITEGSETLIHVLVAAAVANVGAKAAADVYDSAGQHARAQQTLTQLAQACASFNAFHAAVGRAKGNDPQWMKSAGVMAGILLPVMGNQIPPTAAELAPSRYVEQQAAEEFALACLIVVLCVFMLYALLVAFRWRLLLRNTPAAPLLPGLPWRTQARIFLCSVALPLAVYLIYTRWSGLAGREHKLTDILARICIELGVLSLVMLILPGYLTRCALRRHYRELGVPIPPGGQEWLARITGAIGAMIWVLLFAQSAMIPPLWWIMSILGRTDQLEEKMPAAVPFLVPLYLLILASIMFLPMLWERKRRRYGSYFGTLARSMLPLHAVTMLLLTLVIYPACMANERALLHQDRIIFFQEQKLAHGFTPIEDRVVARLRAEMLHDEEHVGSKGLENGGQP